MSTQLESQITSVTVYRNRARVTRTGTIELPEGDTTLVLAGLPRAIDSDSVRISGKGGGITDAHAGLRTGSLGGEPSK